VALLVGGWVAGWLLLWRVPRLRELAVAPEPGPYAVVVPARNEAATIGALVDDLRAQSLPPDEVVVVDDGSDDGTATVASEHGARVITAGDLPDGWTGKSWACHLGAGATTAPTLVFLDADVRLGPDAMRLVVGAVAAQPRLVSVAPWHRVRRPYEWLSLPFGIVSMMGVGLGAPLGRRVVGAYGPCLALPRSAYTASGGHRAIRSEVVDDLALGDAVREAGWSVDVLGGGTDLTYRMYPGGVRSLVEGWTKNIATGARRTPRLRSLLVALWVAGALRAAIGVVDPIGVSLALGAYLLFVLQLRRLGRLTGDFPWVVAVLYPVPLVFFVAVFLRSAVLLAAGRQVRWRGRRLPTRPHEPSAAP